MAKQAYQVAILVVSDTAARDVSSDECIPTLNKTFEAATTASWITKSTKIVTDNIFEIQKSIRDWTDNDDSIDLIVTSGGTGFSARDCTPEAVAPLLHKEAPGLVHGMLSASLAVTPFAIMARPVAGVRHRTLILTLPGSPKGAKENLEAVLVVLHHACRQITEANSRTIHAGGVKRLEREAGLDSPAQPIKDRTHVHDHHHHPHSHGSHSTPKSHTNPESQQVSNDPRSGPGSRHRVSPYPMVSLEEAQMHIMKTRPVLVKEKAAVNSDLIGQVLAEDITATEPVPAFRASIVDGYALIVEPDLPSPKGIFPVVSVHHAAPGAVTALGVGQVARITTGAPLPLGANAVVMVEDTKLASSTEDGQEEREVEILTDKIKPGENVREVGSDIAAGEVILRRDEEITAVGGELGLLASVGRSEVSVLKRPVVGVLSTGDEIVPHDNRKPLQYGQVRDSNRPTIIAIVRAWGYNVIDLGIAGDRLGMLEETLRAAMREVDVIITSGGVSMGELDLLKPTIERSLGGTIHFGRVNMKPGKPTTFATVPFKTDAGERVTKEIFSLPGNPASAVVALHVLVLPALRTGSGQQLKGLPKIRVVLSHDIRSDPQRLEFHRVVVEYDPKGVATATSTGGQRSSRIGSLKSANALLVLPARKDAYKKDSSVEALIMSDVKNADPRSTILWDTREPISQRSAC